MNNKQINKQQDTHTCGYNIVVFSTLVPQQFKNIKHEK